MSKHLLETHIQIQPLPPRSHTFLFPTQLQTLQSRKSFTTKKSSFCLSLCNNKKNSFFFSHVSVVRSSVTRGVNEVEEDKQPVVKKAYPFLEIEPKWQRYWEENRTFRTPDEIDTSKPKFYVLDMFPYPSGAGLHVGHPLGYTATDILARFKRMRGYNVLHPMGWDAFGLPAEQYAIQTGTHPNITTFRNINRFRSQLKSLGFSYDWDREFSTIEPEYYKWTQWIFLQLLKRGLAYQAEVPVNWCPALGTVLANEEVIDGVSERGGHPVIRKPMRQWMLKITAYADRLLEDLDDLDWPESVKDMQRNWIGRSEQNQIKPPSNNATTLKQRHHHQTKTKTTLKKKASNHQTQRSTHLKKSLSAPSELRFKPIGAITSKPSPPIHADPNSPSTAPSPPPCPDQPITLTPRSKQKPTNP